MKKLSIIGIILFSIPFMQSCGDAKVESQDKSENTSEVTDLPDEIDAGKEIEEETNSGSDFIELFLGNEYESGKGENMVKVSFNLENYLDDCADLGVGWVGSYWADGPIFGVNINEQEKELVAHVLDGDCKLESKGSYKIKYIDEETISLTVINCPDDAFIFEGCDPIELKKQFK